MKILKLGRAGTRRTLTPSGKTSWQLYYYEHLEDGRSKRRFRKGFVTRADAEAYYARLADAVREGRLEVGSKSRAPQAATLGDLVAIYEEQQEGKSDRGRARDRNALDRFLAHAGATTPLGEINPLTIDRFLSARQRDGRAPGTVNRELATLKHLFSQAVRWGILEASPAASAKRCREPDKPVVFLERDELGALLAAASELQGRNSRAEPPYLRPLLALAAYSGLRRGELFHLRWRQVDLGARVLVLENSDGFATKSRRGRVVGLSEGALEELEAWRQWFRGAIAEAQERATGRGLRAKLREDASRRLEMLRRCEPRPERLVFPSFSAVSGDGQAGPLTNLDRSLASAVKAAGIKRRVTLHHLRHSFGVYLARQGTPLVQIAHLLGHADLATTQIYLRFAPDEGVMASARLSRIGAAPAKVVEIEEEA